MYVCSTDVQLNLSIAVYVITYASISDCLFDFHFHGFAIPQCPYVVLKIFEFVHLLNK